MNKSVKISRNAGSTGAFTLVELLVVIAIIGILAAMILGLAGASAAGERRKKVAAARDQIITALEAYKKEHGFYPPDNNLNDCRYPPLYYELRGATFDGANFTGHFPTISAVNYLAIFGRQSIANSKPVGSASDQDEDGKVNDHLVGLKSQQTAVLTNNNLEATYLLVGVESDSTFDSIRKNTWRYVSTNPTNNGAGNFDLWAEVLIKGQTEIIGNWNK